MTTIGDPACIWLQLANFFFLLSGMFGDMLIIRLWLVTAYIFLLVTACVGFPLWPAIVRPGIISLDSIIWAILNLFFHGAALLRLIWDERRIRFKSALQQEIWQFFYRRSGMGKLEFIESFKRARVERVEAGGTILTGTTSAHTLMLLVDGLAHFTITDAQGCAVGAALPLHSGQTFDIALLSVLGVYLAFERREGELRAVVADTDCAVVLWDLEDLSALATRCSPAVASFWHNYALCQIGLEWHARSHPDRLPLNARGRLEPAGILTGECRSSDFSDALEPWEDPSPSLRGVLDWLPSTLSPFLPPGFRHTTMPRTGVLARNRLMALGAAHREPAELLSHEPAELRHVNLALVHELRGESARGLGSAGAAASLGGASLRSRASRPLHGALSLPRGSELGRRPTGAPANGADADVERP